MGHLSCVFWLSFYWKNKGWAGWFSGFMAYFFSMFPGISHSHGNKRLLFPISVTMVQAGQAADKPAMHVWKELAVSCKFGKEGLRIWARMIRRIWKGQQGQGT